MMNIEKLQQALVLMNKGDTSGEVFAEHDELHLWPMADAFSQEDVASLEELGFMMNDEGGFSCFT